MKTHRLLLAACAASLALLTSARATNDALEKAAAALKSGDLATADILATPLATAAQPDPAALHLLSQLRAAQKKTKEAVELAERATTLDPTKPEYFSQLGAAMSMRMGEIGFMQQAVLSARMKAAFEKSVELEPRHVSGLIGLARFYAHAPEIAGGSFQKARGFAMRVQEVNPLVGAIELGRIAERAGDWSDALAHYEAALALRPDSAPLLVSAARALAKLDRLKEARERAEAALKIAPDFEPARKLLMELSPSD